MQWIGSSLAALAAILVTLTSAAPAHAAFVTFVSPTGSNANTCTSAADACLTLLGATGAIAKTNPGGILHVLPGEYTAFRIDRAISIIADPGGQASVGGSTIDSGGLAAGISVETAATDFVLVRGLVVLRVDGNGGNIVLQSAGVLHIDDCTFVGGSESSGILFAPSGVGELQVSNSTMSNNGTGAAGAGVLIKPIGSGSAKAVLDNVHVDESNSGIIIDGRVTTGTNSVTIRNSVVSSNALFGLTAFDNGDGATNVSLEGSSITNNEQQGIIANGANVTVRMRSSFVTGNRVGLAVSNGGKIISHGDNVNAGNTVAQGAFTQTLAPQ